MESWYMCNYQPYSNWYSYMFPKLEIVFCTYSNFDSTNNFQNITIFISLRYFYHSHHIQLIFDWCTTIRQNYDTVRNLMINVYITWQWNYNSFSLFFLITFHYNFLSSTWLINYHLICKHNQLTHEMQLLLSHSLFWRHDIQL